MVEEARNAETTQAPCPPAPEKPAEGSTDRGPTLNLPFVTLNFHKQHIPLPRIDPRKIADVVDAARARLPRPERIAYYAGLGAAALLELIEWPVAVAIGAGSMIAQRVSGQRQDTGGDRAGRPQAAPAQAAQEGQQQQEQQL